MVVGQEILFSAIFDFDQSRCHMILKKLSRFRIKFVGQRLRISHTQGVHICKHNMNWKYVFLTLKKSFLPVNRSFQTVRGTLLKVITPLTVSRKSDQVELKSTRLGFKDMIFPSSFVLKFWTKAKWNYGTEICCLQAPGFGLSFGVLIFARQMETDNLFGLFFDLLWFHGKKSSS